MVAVERPHPSRYHAHPKHATDGILSVFIYKAAASRKRPRLYVPDIHLEELRGGWRRRRRLPCLRCTVRGLDEVHRHHHTHRTKVVKAWPIALNLLVRPGQHHRSVAMKQSVKVSSACLVRNIFFAEESRDLRRVSRGGAGHNSCSGRTSSGNGARLVCIARWAEEKSRKKRISTVTNCCIVLGVLR